MKWPRSWSRLMATFRRTPYLRSRTSRAFFRNRSGAPMIAKAFIMRRRQREGTLWSYCSRKPRWGNISCSVAVKFQERKTRAEPNWEATGIRSDSSLNWRRRGRSRIVCWWTDKSRAREGWSSTSKDTTWTKATHMKSLWLTLSMWIRLRSNRGIANLSTTKSPTTSISFRGKLTFPETSRLRDPTRPNFASKNRFFDKNRAIHETPRATCAYHTIRLPISLWPNRFLRKRNPSNWTYTPISVSEEPSVESRLKKITCRSTSMKRTRIRDWSQSTTYGKWTCSEKSPPCGRSSKW